MTKTRISITGIILLCALLLGALSGCTGSGESNATTGASDTTAEPQMLDIVRDGVSDFIVVRGEFAPANLINAAKDVFKAIGAAAGDTVGIRDDWVNPNTHAEISAHEICVGDVSRNGIVYNIDPASIPANSFIVRVVDGRIVLLGHDPYGSQLAAEWFIENYLTLAEGQKTVSVPENLDYMGTYEPLTGIRYMTQNLLATDDEYVNNMKDPAYAARCTADLSKHTLAKRAPRVLDLIKTYKPDSLGVQECSAEWRTYFDAKLSSIGYARIGANKNQKIGIIYNTSTLKVIESASFWLTESPEKLKISAEWGKTSDGLTERLGMYVVFEVLSTGERYVHFNTHLDTPKNSVIQTKQTEVLLDYVAKVREKYAGIPVVLTGDFNYNSSTSAYSTLVGGLLGDAKKLAASSSGAGSFNKFIGQDYASLPIDQMMLTPDVIDVQTYKVLYDRVDGCFISDHYAVIADITFKK